MKKQMICIVLGFFYILISVIHPIAAEWSNPVVVSTESNKSAYRAILGIDNDDTLHIAWKDNSNYSNAGDDWDIFYKFKPADGSWTKTEVVSVESTNDSNCLFMSVDKNKTVHVVWKDQTDIDNAGDDFDIFYKYKPFNGNWSKIQLVSVNSTKNSGCPCSVIDKNGNLHVVWSDCIDCEASSNEWNVYYSRLNDDNFSFPELVSAESTAESFEPVIAVDSKLNIHVVWYEKSNYGNSGDDFDIFYKYKPFNGNWSETQVVSKESTGSSTIPALTVDSDDVLHLVWVDTTNINNAGSDGDIFYKNKSLDKDWSELQVVSTESNTFGHWPSITTDLNDTVHVVWKDKIVTNNSFRYDDIFYKYKPKNGEWSNLELVSKNSKKESNWGSIVTDSKGGVHVTWWDDFDGRWVMYYSNRTSVDINLTTHINGGKNDTGKNDNTYNIFYIILVIITILFIIFIYLKKK